MSRPEWGAGPGPGAGPSVAGTASAAASGLDARDPSLDGIVRELAESLEHRVAGLLTVTATVVQGLSDEPGAADVTALVEHAIARAAEVGGGERVPSLLHALARADDLARQLAGALADLYVYSCAEAGSQPLTRPAPPVLRSPR